MWTRRRVAAAIVGALAVALVLGTPTDLVPNPFFTRMTPVTWWAWPIWGASAVVSGLLLATYLRGDGEGAPPTAARGRDRRGIVGGALSYLAVGCPVCNKLVVLALGTTGAMTWFAPAQPVLAVLALVLLTVALRRRLSAARACPVPVETP